MFFNDFTQSQKIADLWTAQARENLARVEAWNAKFQTLSQEQAERTRDAIDEGAKLMRATVDWTQEMLGAWQRFGTEATHKAADLVTPPAREPEAKTSAASTEA
jgi:urease accessory protein UreF